MVRNRCTSNTEVASLTPAGTVQPIAGRPVSISDDACAVAFETSAPIVTPAPGVTAVIVRDRCQGTTTRADVSTEGVPGNAGADYTHLSAGTGRYVAFDSGASNLVQRDNGKAPTRSSATAGTRRRRSPTSRCPSTACG